MVNYKVSFFKQASKDDDKKQDEYLGSVTVDDIGVSNTLTIVAKAFRQAPSICLMSDKTITERV